MTYVIAEPCIDVKDKACVDECPVDCIYEGEPMLYIHPRECVDCGAASPCARSRHSSTKTTCPASGPSSPPETPRSSTSSARPAVPPRPARCPCEQVTGMWYRLEVRLTPADVGKRVVIRWRPGPGDSKQMTDVLGILEQADAGSFTVRTRDGTLVVIPAGRALAGKVVPPPPARRRRAGPRLP